MASPFIREGGRYAFSGAITSRKEPYSFQQVAQVDFSGRRIGTIHDSKTGI